MTTRTAVVLGVQGRSLKDLQDRLTPQGFSVIGFIPPRKLRSNDVVIVSPAYESPTMAQYVSQELRLQVGNEVPVVLLSEHAVPLSNELGVKVIRKSVSAIAQELGRLAADGAADREA